MAIESNNQSPTVTPLGDHFVVVLQGMVRNQMPSQSCTDSAIQLQYSTETTNQIVMNTHNSKQIIHNEKKQAFLVDCVDQMLQ